MTSDHAPAYLPGLVLKLATDTDVSTTSGSSPPSSGGGDAAVLPSSLTVSLKQFDDQEFKLFSEGQQLSLLVTYTGGVKDYDEEKETDDGDDDVGAEKEGDEDPAEVKEEDYFSLEVELQKEDPNHIEVISKVYDVKEDSVSGYYSFDLDILNDWKPEKEDLVLEVLELTLSVHDGNSANESSGNSGATVGETFVIDVAQGVQDNVFLEWDFTDILMRQVFSPTELKAFENERVPLEILFLAAADNALYNALEPLTMNLNLTSFLSKRNSDDLVVVGDALEMKVYSNVETSPNLRKGTSDALKEAIIQNEDNMLQLGQPEIVVNADRQGWVSFKFHVSNILAGLLAFYKNDFDLTNYGGGTMTQVEIFQHIMNPDAAGRTHMDDRIRNTILDIIQSVRLSVVVVEKSTNNVVGEFLVDGLESNNMYYDSAVQLLSNKENWDREILKSWSAMAFFSSLNDFNSLFRFSKFKVTGEESAPATSSTNNGETFETTVEVPSIDGIDPGDLCILIQKFDQDTVFQGTSIANDNDFLLVSQPSKTSRSANGNTATFSWGIVNAKDSASKNASFNVTIMVRSNLSGEADPSYGSEKKIGSTSTFSRTIGTPNNFHKVTLKLRNAITLGIVDTNPLEEATARFVEKFYSLLFQLSNEGNLFTRTQIVNASEDISEICHRNRLLTGTLKKILYNGIWHSYSTLSLVDGAFDKKNEDDITQFVMNTISSMKNVVVDTLPIVLKLLGEETDSMSENNLERFRNNLETLVLNVNGDHDGDLSVKLNKYSLETEAFISSGELLFDEIVAAQVINLEDDGNVFQSAETNFFGSNDFCTIHFSPGEVLTMKFHPKDVKPINNPPRIECEREKLYELLSGSEVVVGYYDTLGSFKAGTLKAQDSQTFVFNKSQVLFRVDSDLDAGGMTTFSLYSYESTVSQPMEHVALEAMNVSQQIGGLSVMGANSYQTASLQSNSIAMINDIQSKLIKELEATNDSCESVQSVFESAQDIMNTMAEPLVSIQNFRNEFNQMNKEAKSMTNAVKYFVPFVLRLGSYCPLWPVKAIINIIKNPIQTLVRAMNSSQKTIHKLNSKVQYNTFLKNLMKTKRRIETSVDKLDKPISGIEKIQSIIDQVLDLARSGFLPMELLSELAENTTLTTFFSKLKRNAESITKVLGDVNNLVAGSLKPIVSKINGLIGSIRQKYNSFRPIDTLFKNVRPWVDKAVGVLRRSVPWWLKWTIQAAMKPIEWTIGLLLRPFQSTIRSIVDRLNPFRYLPFGNLSYLMDELSKPALANQLNFVDSLVNANAFRNIGDVLTHVSVLCIRGLTGMFSYVLQQAALNYGGLETKIEGTDIYNLLYAVIEAKQMSEGIGEFSLGDAILEFKTDMVDDLKSKSDFYLRQNLSNQPLSYTDSFGSKVQEHGHELLYCFVNPEEDLQSHLFKRSQGTLSWVAAPMSSLIYHAQMTNQAYAIGLLDEDEVVKTDFLPKIYEDGRCDIKLFPRLTEGAKTFTVDTRLPVQKFAFTFPGSASIESLTGVILDYVQNKVSAPISSTYSSSKTGSVSWALVEKAVLCHLENKENTIGTGVHLLSGMLENTVKYTRNAPSGKWMIHDSFTHRRGSKYDTIQFWNASSKTMNNDLEVLQYIQLHTISMYQNEKLQLSTTTKLADDEMEELRLATKSLSMFIGIHVDGSIHPILFHDDTDKRHPIYCNGMSLHPMTDFDKRTKTLSDSLSKWVEIWEFPIKPSPDGFEILGVDSTKGTISTKEISGYKEKAACDVCNVYEPSAMPSSATNSSSISQFNIRPAVARSGNTNDLDREWSDKEKSEVTAIFDRLITKISKQPNGWDKYQVQNEAGDRKYKRRDLSEKEVRPSAIVDLFRVLSRPKERLSPSQLLPNDFVQVQFGRSKRFGILQRKKNRDDWYVFVYKTAEVPEDVDEKPQPSNAITIDKSKIKRMEEKDLAKAFILYKRGIFVNTIPRQPHLSNPQSQGPEEWGMTYGQLKKYVHYCMGPLTYKQKPGRASNPEWRGTKELNGDQNFGKTTRVTLHDLNNLFLKKHTKGTGMSAALNMQKPGSPSYVAQMNAKVMISHSWSEDMEEVIEMLEKFKGTKLRTSTTQPAAFDDEFGDDTPIWFCALSQFQVNAESSADADPLGPTVAAQVAKDPFEKVIQNSGVLNMIVLQTSTSDPYTRYWCAVELYEAMKLEDKGEFTIHACFSQRFQDLYTHVKELNRAATYRQVDSTRDVVPHIEVGLDERTWREMIDEQNPNPNRVKPLYKRFQKEYSLLKRNETTKITAKDMTDKFNDIYRISNNSRRQEYHVGKEIPKLKYNIAMNSMGSWRPSDIMLFDKLSGKERNSNNDSQEEDHAFWMNMQNRIVQFYEGVFPGYGN